MKIVCAAMSAVLALGALNACVAASPQGHAVANPAPVDYARASDALSAIVFTTSYDDECPAQGVKACVISRKLGGLPSLKYLPEPKDE